MEPPTNQRHEPGDEHGQGNGNHHPRYGGNTQKMVEADINGKKEDNTMEDGAKPQTGVNKTPNLINVIASRTLEIRKLGLKLSRPHQ